MSRHVQARTFEVGNTPHCELWRESIYRRHRSLSSLWKRKHQQLTESQGYPQANQWLLQQEKSLKVAKTGLYADCDDQEIIDYCEAKSKLTEKQIFEARCVMGSTLTLASLVQFLSEKCENAGVEFPALANASSEELKAAIRRLVDPIWWRRQIRKLTARALETYMRQFGVVSVSQNIYCSDLTLRRRTFQKARNRKLLESLEAENSQGQVYTLAQLSDLSVSNPINRRNELMVRISGFEEYAKHNKAPCGANYQGLFLTLTAPSKFHAQTIRKRSTGGLYAVENLKFNGSTPIDTNDYLNKVWANIRAEWQRQDIHAFGFRMAEPHHDGTPHWHFLLFLPNSKSDRAVEIFRDYALREDGNEPGAKEKRIDAVRIDPRKGSAAGYCAKYVAKNIDGYGVENDSYGKSAIISAMRIEAWASTWGIRQFQQIGGPSVTVWRESRRIRDTTSIELSEAALRVLAAADDGDWQTYTELMGGACLPLKERPIRPWVLPKPESNKYGEISEFLNGILAFGVSIPTRTESWVIRPVSNMGLNNAAPCAANAPPKAA